MQKRRNQRRRGFTLIEIMAVVVIIGLLMTLVANGIIGNIQKSRVTATQVKIQQVGAALTSYYMDNGRFPSSEQGLRALFEKPSGAPEPRGWRPGGYLDKKEIPRDAWELDRLPDHLTVTFRVVDEAGREVPAPEFIPVARAARRYR